jgi:hypothetical protein
VANDLTPQNPYEAEPEDLLDFSEIRLRDYHKEATAKQIAWHLLQTFRYALLLVLGLGFGTLFYEQATQPQSVGSLMKDSIVPFVSGVGTFSSTLFGPLLAFVLGHYFGQRDHK